MENRRVVVTGMGAISPLGNSVSALWSALLRGECGIGPITRFDTENYKVKVAAEVRDFDPRQYLKPARAAVKAMVAHKLVNVLGCDGKA